MPDRPADLVLTGGRVHAIDPAKTVAEALAVRDGRIVAVGRADEVRPRIGRQTRVIELRGRAVLPGFQDAHVHATNGMEWLRCWLNDVRGGPAAVLGAIAAYALAHPELPWVVGSGWYMPDFPGGTPSRHDLDRVVPDRPAYFDNRDGHGAWVNSRAMELAGIGRDTADPPGGRIERDADGTPSGTLHEAAADLVADLAPPVTAADWLEGLRLGQAYLHGLGITAWQDAGVSPGAEEDAYLALARSGRLTGRVIGSLQWDSDRGLEQIDELVERRATTAAPNYRPTAVKIFQDGVLENYSGAMLEPYLGADGRPTDNRGISLVEPPLLNEAVTRLDRLGFQVHLHAIGDRAVREALDAFEAARRVNGRSDRHHHIAHIQVIHPDDLPRFAALDVVANGQPYWAALEPQMVDLTIPFLGPERSTWQYPFGSLLRAGARLAFGSDWAVSTADPLAGIELAVNRVSEDHRDHEPFLPDERISLDAAVRAYTLGAAWVNHLESETGTLEVGKLADLVVLDRDLFGEDAGPPADAGVVGTFVEGRPVHEAPALDA